MAGTTLATGHCHLPRVMAPAMGPGIPSGSDHCSPVGTVTPTGSCHHPCPRSCHCNLCEHCHPHHFLSRPYGAGHYLPWSLSTPMVTVIPYSPYHCPTMVLVTLPFSAPLQSLSLSPHRPCHCPLTVPITVPPWPPPLSPLQSLPLSLHSPHNCPSMVLTNVPL